MATYITEEQVASEARLGSSGFTSSTNPTSTKASEIIDEVEAEIDCIIATKYAIPLTQTRNIALVRSIALAIAAARVRKIIDSNLPENAEQSLHQKAEKDARSRLADILHNRLLLLGEEPAVSGNGIKSYASSNGLTPTFERDTQQW